MIWIFLAPLVIGIAALIIIPLVLEKSNIDRCLDQGGSFNYESCSCDYQKAHPYKSKHDCN